MEIQINYVAVLVAAIASMVFGYLWYSPLVMGKPWMKLMGYTPESMKEGSKGMGKKMLAAFVAQIIMAFVLAHTMGAFSAFSPGGVMGAFQLAFWPWLGFVATVSLGSVLWEGRPKKLYKINIAHWFLTMLIMALVLTFWQ